MLKLRYLPPRRDSSYRPVEQKLFSEDDLDATLLYPLISTGASAMKAKLCSYAKSLLPGGRYWEPEPEVEAILRNIKPNNDLCESILGLNDYLMTAIPNLHQLSRSSLIEVKKNKTMSWFHKLSDDQRRVVIDLAVGRRRAVAELYKREEEVLSAQRREKMAKEKSRRDALEMRASDERERLANLPLMNTKAQLDEALANIESQSMTAKKKSDRKRALIREQVRIRKNLLKQNIKIPITEKGRQRPLKKLIDDLTHFIESNSSNSSDYCHASDELTPESLIGRDILHRFMMQGEEKWFNGYILSYNAVSCLHKVSYEGEEEPSYFNLMDDIKNGDLIIDN